MLFLTECNTQDDHPLAVTPMIFASPSIGYTGIPFSPSCVSKWVRYSRIILGYVSLKRCETITPSVWFRTSAPAMGFLREMDPDNWDFASSVGVESQGGSSFNHHQHDWWNKYPMPRWNPNNAESNGYHGTPRNHVSPKKFCGLTTWMSQKDRING